MHTCLSPPIGKTLLLSALPLLIAGISYIAETTILLMIYLTHSLTTSILISPIHQKAIDDSQIGSSSSYIFKCIQETSRTIYSSYAHFMITMIVLHLLLTIYSHLWKSKIQQTLEDNISQEHRKSISSHLQEYAKQIWQLVGKGTVSALIKYSIIYCIYTFVSTGCCYFVTTNPEILYKTDAGSGYVEGDVALASMMNIDKGVYSTRRTLQEQDSIDILAVIGSVEYPNFNYQAKLGIYNVNITYALLFGDQTITHIDVSNYSSPQIISISNIGVSNASNIQSYFISPDAQRIAVTSTESTGSAIYIADVSDPGSSVKIKAPSNSLPAGVFCPDSTRGYIYYYNGTTDVYEFNMDLEEMRPIASFGSDVIPSTVRVSSDCTLVFIDLQSVTDGNDVVGIIRNLPNSTSGEVLANFSLNNIDAQIIFMILSHDDKTLFTGSGTGILSAIDVSDPAKPSLLSSIQLPLEDIWLLPALSPDSSILFIGSNAVGNNPVVIVDVSDPKQPFFAESNAIFDIDNVAFSSDGSLLFMSTTTSFQICSLQANLKSMQQQVAYVPLNIDVNQTEAWITAPGIAVSSDYKTVFIASFGSVAVFSISDKAQLTLVNTLIIGNAAISSITLLADNKTLLVAVTGDDSIDIYLFDVANITKSDKICGPCEDTPKAPLGFIPMPNRQTLLAISVSDLNEDSLQNAKVILYDVENQNLPKDFVTVAEYNLSSVQPLVYTTGPDIIAIGANNSISLYNVPNIHTVTLISQTTTSDVNDDIFGLAISHDGQILLTLVNNQANDECSLVIYNISNPSSINLISSFTLGASMDISGLQSNAYNPLFINSNTVLVAYQLEFQIIDLSLNTDPYLHSTIYDEGAMAASIALLSPSTDTPILITDPAGQLRTVTLKDQYVIDMPNISVGLGEIYNERMTVYRRNKFGGYTIQLEGFVIVKASLYKVSERLGSSFMLYPSLPSWISFDNAYNSLTVAPITEEVIGSYSVYFVLSSQIEMNEFANIDETIDSIDFITEFVAMGYITTEYYLTSSFDPDKQLILSYRFRAHEKKIRKILSNHAYGALKRVHVESSLVLQAGVPTLSLMTPSQLPLTVSISLGSNYSSTTPQCQFVTHIASTITPTFLNEFTATLQGLVFEVDNTLANMIINLSDDNVPCDGILIVEDGLNPQLNLMITNISDFFQKNQAPVVTLFPLFQEKLQKMYLETGTYFELEIDPAIFSQHDLTLTLVHRDKDATWLTVSGYTLSGTPPSSAPYQMWSNKYNVVIRASNEYKSTEIEFTLVVHMSIWNVLKLVGEILGIIGVYVYFHTILNILAQKWYKDPQPWIVKTNDDIVPASVFPVAFIAEDKRAAHRILRQLRRALTKKLNVDAVNNAGLVRYFINPADGQLDMKRLVSDIEGMRYERAPTRQDLEAGSETLNNIDGHKISETQSRKRLVHQLIVNELVMCQLRMSDEKLTAVAFDKIKKRWRSMVRTDELFLWQFSVDEDKLQKEIDPKRAYRRPTLRRRSTIIRTLSRRSSLILGAAQTKPSDRQDVKQPKSKCIDENDVISLNDLSILKSSTDTGEDVAQEPTGTCTTTSNVVDDKPTQINLTLLKRALIAHAFEKHHINARAVDIHINTYHKGTGLLCLPGAINRCLKLDLDPIRFSRTDKIDCGIEYRVVRDVLEFHGKADEDVEYRTMVVQIRSNSGRILKEMTICGVRSEEERQALLGAAELKEKFSV